VNPYAVRVTLRPRTAFEVFDLAAAVSRESPGAFVRLSAAVLLPAFGVTWAFGWFMGEAWFAMMALIALMPAIQLPFLMLGARLLFDRDATATLALRDLWGELGATIGLLVLGWAGLVLAVCSGTILSFLLLPLVFAAETTLLERSGVGAGIRRSATLVQDALGSVLIGGVVMIGLPVWAALVGEATGRAVVGFVLQLGEPFGSLLYLECTPWVIIGVLLAQPLISLYRLLLYVNVRTIREGWDVQIALRAAAEEA
jgi:hypothetical protein